MFPLPLIITIHPSRRLRAALVGLHGLACAALGLAQLSLAITGIGLLLLSASLWYCTRPPPACTLRFHKEGTIEMLEGDGWTQVFPDGPPVILPGLLGIRLRTPDRKRPIFFSILSDCLDADQFRRLRVWLNWKSHG